MAGLALSGFKSEGSVHTKGRALPALQSKATSVKVTGDNQSLCRSGQEQAPQRILTGTNPKTGGREGHGPFFSGFLQPVISGSKAQQQIEAHPRPQSIKLVPSFSLLQNGNPRDHQTLPSKRGVGHFIGFQRRLLSYSNKSKVAQVSEIPSQWSNVSVHRPTLRPFHGSVGVHEGRQGGQIDGTVSRYPNPPVPRRLVGESSLPGDVPTSFPDPLGPVLQARLGNQIVKVGTVSPTSVQLCRLSFRPLSEVGDCLRKSNFSCGKRPAQSGSSCPSSGF